MANKELSLAIRIAGKVDSSLRSALDTVGSGISSCAKTLGAATAAATAAVGAIASAAIDVGKEFESSMSQVSATMLIDTSTAEGLEAYQTLEDAARECGRTTAFSATEAAEALNYLALAGYDASEAATALPTILNLAGAGAMDLATASDMVTDAMSALQLDVTEDNLNTFADQLAKTASSANTSVEQLGEGILTVGATAANLAGGTTELNTALGILADVGIKGSEGGTHLRNIILKLQQPTSDAAKIMDELGVSVYDAEGNMNSLQDIFGDLNAAMSDMSQQDVDEIMGTLFNKTDLAAANAMLANCTDRWDELSDAIENSAGACEEMYNIQLDNLEGDVSKLSSGLSDLGISIYKDLQTPLRDVTQLATGMVSELSAAYSSGGLEGMVGAVGDVLAGAVADLGAYVPQAVDMGISLISSFVDGIGQSSGEIADIAASTITTFITGASALLPDIILTGVDVILNFVNGIIANIPAIISTGAQAISNFVSGLSERLPDIITTGINLIISLITGIGDAIPSLIESAGTLVTSLIDAIRNTNWKQVGIDIITALGRGVINAVSSIGSTIWGAVKSIFTGGGSDTSAAEAELEAIGTDLTESYAYGIEAGADAAAAAAESITAITADLDTSAMAITGADTVDAYTAGITTNIPVVTSAADELGLSVVDSLNDTWDVVQSTTETAMQAVAESLSEIPADLDASTMEVVGSEAAEAYALGLASGMPLIASTIDEFGDTIVSGLNASWETAQNSTNAAMQAVAESITTITPDIDMVSMQAMGTETAEAYAAGITTGIPTIVAATDSMGLSAVESLNMSWETIQSSAETAMQTVAETTTAEARQTADAIRDTFAGIEITIPVEITTANDMGLDIFDSFSSGWGAVQASTDAAMRSITETTTAEALQTANTIETTFGDMDITIPVEIEAANDAGLDIFDGFAEGWATVQSSADTAMQAVIESTTRGAQEAAGAIEDAFAGISLDTLEGAGVAVIEAYVDDITANIPIAVAATDGMISEAFSDIDLSGAGLASVESYSEGITSNIPTVTAAADEAGLSITDSLSTGWTTAQSDAEAAMTNIAQAVTSEAQAAANAVKDAFEGMEIVIPKPKMPVITTSYRTETYGEGGSVQIPQFDVNWNALGGIFDQATLFGGDQGLQGVGEAGPEAVLPLDSLWDELEEILTEAIRSNSEPGLIETLLDKISGTNNGSTAGPSYEYATGGASITYAPVYNLYGSATREDAVAAEKTSQAEFAKLMREYERNNKRVKF